MASDNKRIAKNTGLLYIRQLLTLGLSLYTSRLTLQVLGETDFGVYATVAGFTALLSTLTTSLASGTQRFISFELGRGNIQRLNIVYCTAINIHLILSIVLIIIGETIGVWFIFNKMNVPQDRLITAFWVFQMTILNSVLALINSPNNAEIIAHEDMGVWAFVSILEVVLRCICVIGLFYISWDKLIVYSVSLFSIQLLMRAICIGWCKRKYTEVHFRFIWDIILIKSMLSVTGWIGFNNLAVTGFIQGVNIMLNVFFGPMLNAAYTIAMQAYSGIRQFCSSFQLASNPQIVKLYSKEDFKSLHELLISVCKFSFFLIFVLALPFLINAKAIMHFWLKDVPAHCESFFIILLIYAFIDVLVYPLYIAAQATGKLRNYSISISLAVLSILLIGYIAFTMGSIPESIYIVAIIMSWVSLTLRLLFLRKLIRLSFMDFIRNVILRIIFVGLTSVILPLILLYLLDESILSSVILFVVSFLFPILSVFFIGLNETERNMLKKGISLLMSKIGL